MRRIVSNNRILGGKPVIEGTRMSVDQVLGLLANGMSAQEIYDAYPILTKEDVFSAVAWARAALSNDVILDLAPG